MNEGYPSCKTCTCFFRSHPNSRNGQCRARSPVPILLGMAQPAALPIIAKNGGGQPQPIINGFFPPVNEDIWCMDWQPLAEGTPAELVERIGAKA